MKHKRTALWLAASLTIVGFTTAIAQKRPLTHDDVAKWNKIKANGISADGNWVWYQYGPDEGDNTLVVKEIGTENELIIPRGAEASFTYDSKFLICLVNPQLDSLRALKRLKKKKEELPDDSLAIYNLANGELKKVPGIKSYKMPKKAGTWIAYLTTEQKDKADTISEKKKKQSIDNGYLLKVLRLVDGEERSFPYVKNYVLSETGSRLAFYSSGDEKEFSSGIYSVAASDLVLKPVYRQKGEFDGLQMSKDGSRLAFLFDADTLKKPFQSYGLYHWAPSLDSGRALIPASDPFLPKNWQLASDELRFSDDNKRLFFGTQVKPVIGDTTLLYEEKAELDVWHYKEGYLQTQQKVTADKDKKNGFSAVYHFGTSKPVQLENENRQEVKTTMEGLGNYGLATYESDDYRRISSWEGSPASKDIFIIDINTGVARPVASKERILEEVSPGGKFAYWFNVSDTAWYSLELATGLTRKLTDNASVSYADELNDSPNYPEPYGVAGWLENDSFILIYDRYDIWKINAANPAIKERVTKNGRETSVVYRYVKTDPEQRFISSQQTSVLKTFNVKSRQHGFSSMQFNKSAAPTLLLMEDAKLSFQKKARESDVWLITKETYELFPDLLVTDDSFKNPNRITNINPQKEEFLWGSEELVQWTSLDGLALEGLLYKPDNFDPARMYPMMVYFYERNADTFHSHIIPEFERSIINFTFYTSRGYLVFVPDIVYKIGYPGESAINCVMPGITSLIDKGFVDKGRIGVQGHSWGGYQIAYMVTKTQLFKAAEAGAPVPNMTSAYGGIRWQTGLSRMFQYEHTQSRIGGTLWEYPLRYLENSPLFWLDKVNTPVLIMHNDADGHVPWYQGIELFSGLRRLGKPTWLISYNDQPHWPLRYPNRRDWTIRLQQYFDHYLMDAPAPEWMVKGVPAVEKGANFGLELSEDKN